MATYKYKDVERALLVCGFKPQKNTNGSHQIYVDEKTGFAQPLPKHSNGVIAPGTAESILNYAVMVARIKDINIANDRYKLSRNVIAYIIKQHSKIKENIMNLVPEPIRIQRGLKTPDDVLKFLKEFIKKCRPKKQNEDEFIK